MSGRLGKPPGRGKVIHGILERHSMPWVLQTMPFDFQRIAPKLSAYLVSARWLLLAFGALLALVAYPSRQYLRVERRIEGMLIPGDPVRSDFEFLAKRFGGNEVVLCVFDIPDLWDPEGSGIAKLESISKRLREVAGVKEVMDLSRLNASLSLLQPKGLFGGFGVAAAESSKITLFDRENQLAKEMLGLFEGYTHISDSKTTAILCMLEPTMSTKEQAMAIDGIQRIVREPILNDASMQGYAIGEPILVHDGFRMVEADGKGLGVAATIILSLLLLIGFRSIRWAIIAIVVVQWSLVVTEGCIVWCDMHLTMVSSMLSALVTVIGVATTIHWMMSYQIEYEKTGDARIAIESSLRQRIIPIVFACVTDAIGFGSLMVARVGPVRDYGLMMSLASMVVLVGILTWIPALATLGSSGFGLRQIPGDTFIRTFLSWSLAMLRRHPRVCLC